MEAGLLEEENKRLKLRLQELEQRLSELERANADVVTEKELMDGTFVLPPLPQCDNLKREEVRRYSRQLLIQEVGVDGNQCHSGYAYH